MKPFSAGTPMADSVTIRKIAAKTGVTRNSPPNAETSHVCLRAQAMPAIRNSAPIEIP
jgi:hypothetical protein